MNRFRRDFLAAYISASSDPATYGKITVLTIPGQVNGPKLAFNAISTDTAVSQDLGVIGRDNQNRIRWGNLLTLPVGQGGLLYVSPVYASPGASDAASSYPRLIRVAMMYNDKVGYGPTVRDALDGIFGAGRRCDGHRSRPDRTRAAAGQPPGTAAAAVRRRRPANPEVPDARRGRRRPPGGAPTALSRTKAAALQDIETAIDAVQAGPAERQLRRVRRGAAASRRRDEQVHAPPSSRVPASRLVACAICCSVHCRWTHDGRRVDIGPPKQRAVLAALLLARGGGGVGRPADRRGVGRRRPR